MSEQLESHPAGTSVFALSSWSLRRKLALALAIPLVLAATLGGLRVSGDLKEAANSSTSARQVTVLRPAIDYLTAASRAMMAAQADTWAGESEVHTAVANLTAAAARLERTRATADLTAEQSHQIDVVLDLSRVLREDSKTLSPDTWVAQVRQLQTGVNRLITTIANAQLEPQPGLQLLTETLTGRFSLAMQQALAATSRAGDNASLDLFAELGTESAAVDRLASSLGDSEPVVKSLLSDNARRTRTVRTGGLDLGGLRAFTGYDTLVGSLLADVDAQLAASADAARTRAFLNAGLTTSALAVAILLALLVSRMLLNPIRRVREGALAVAHEHLPEAVGRIRSGGEPAPIAPLDVHTTEEVGQLARAVDDLHRQAVILAAGEAELRSQVSEMFVTLSRRNTSLVNQQLGLIDALEKDEEDPARLENLFRLDHLASRMRRTADSLLVLADAPSQPTGQQSLTVSEAMQAATAGVQDYQRVQVGAGSLGTRISDEAASDVVHLLTELVDNALAYSPPSATVSIGSALTADGAVLDIVDRGLGIADDTLAELNDRLRAGAAVTADSTRRMGLFVVSRLAQRHGIDVALRPNDEGGTTATVVLPTAILPDLEPAAPGSAPAVRSVRPEPTPVAPQPATKPETSKPVRPKAEPKPEPARLAEVPVETLAAAASVTRLQAVLDGALGSGLNGGAGKLPVRRPGASLADSPASLSADAPPLPLREPQPVVDPEAIPEPEPVSARPPEPVAERPLAPVPDTQPLPQPAPVAEPALVAAIAVPEPVPEPVPVAVSVVEPAPQERPDPLAAPVSSLDRTSDDDTDSPIFRSMRSAWLTANGESEPWTTSEVEAGWDVADQVVSTPAVQELTPAGLPQRRPGARLVPGGVTKQGSTVARDPEAVRARLSAHAAGVSRGRRASTAPVSRITTDHPDTEADPHE